MSQNVEKHEHQATAHALDTLANWMRSGTNEGISFEIARLTYDLFTDSFLGGGDCSLFTASGKRGTLQSQLSNAYLLSSSGGVPQSFAINLSFDLNTAQVTGTWTYPGGQVQSSTFTLEFFKQFASVTGKVLLFYADHSSDDAAYSLSFLLL